MKIKIILEFKPSLLFLLRLFRIVPLHEIENFKFGSCHFLEKILNYLLRFYASPKKTNRPMYINIYFRNECFINSNFYVELKKYLNTNKNLILYSDSMVKFIDHIEYIARPIWSPTLFENLDYLGEVIIFSSINDNIFNWKYNFKDIWETEKFTFIRIPEALYSIVMQNNFFNINIYERDKKNISFLTKINQEINKSPDFTIIIPTKFQKNGSSLSINRLINSILKNFEKSNYELIVGYQTRFEETFHRNILKNNLYKHISIKSYKYNYDFNFSKVVNECVRLAEHEYILLLNDDIYFEDKINLNCILNHLIYEKVGVVGTKLLYPNKLIQHDGIYFENFQPQNFLQGSDINFMPYAQNFCREVTAVSGAFMFFRKKIFQKYGGFSEVFPNNYNDVEFCLRLQENGLTSIICNSSAAYHQESLTRNEDKYLNIVEDLNKLRAHHKIHIRDKYLYTPNFSKAIKN